VEEKTTSILASRFDPGTWKDENISASFCLFVLTVLGFELKDFAFVMQELYHLSHIWLILRWGLAFGSVHSGSWSSYFRFSTVTGMTSACHHAHFPLRWCLISFFFFAWAGLEL
jgi:hypothetical protein